MQAILKKLNELVGVCEVRVAKAENDKVANANLKVSLDARESDLKSLAESLKAREAKIDLHENIEVLRKELERGISENKDTSKRLKEQESKQNELHAKKMKEVEDSVALLDQQKEKLAKQSRELAKEKETYKQTVISEIEKNMTVKIK